MESYNNYISLGSNCFFKKYLSTNKKSAETHFFDWIGTSMWSIVDLFTNNFAEFTNKNMIKKVKIFQNKDMCYFTNKKYYVRLQHDFDHKKDFVDDTTIKGFADKYERRRIRLLELLNKKDSKILFFRLQEELDHRIIYDDYKDKLNKKEGDYLIDFSNILKNKYPELKFSIIYINYDGVLSFNNNNNIISIPSPKKIVWHGCDKAISTIITDNLDFINKNLETLN